MSTFNTDLRAAAVALLTDYAASAGIKLQVYPGRPASIYPPTAFVDGMGQVLDWTGISLHQDTPRVELVVLHGLYDSAEAATQRDLFLDGFVDWCAANPHESGANTLIAPTRFDDEPDYTATWLPPDAREPERRQRTFYATRITLEGFATN